MHELLSVAQMSQADALATQDGIASMKLMENAGRAVFEVAMPFATNGRPVLVACGTGNNGGDGLVAARNLAAQGVNVTAAVLGDTARMKGDAATALQRYGGRAVRLEEVDARDFGLVVDALFGAGLDRDIAGAAATFIAGLNDGGNVVIAVDLPSGIHGDSGRVMGAAVRAAATVTFFRKKSGHLLMPGREYCGRIVLAQIGIRDSVLAELKPIIVENEPSAWASKIRLPRPDQHKYHRGHALVVSGTACRTGAARLAASGALVAGAGLVTLASPAEALTENACHLTEIMLRHVGDAVQLSETLADARFSSVALGPGLGVGTRTKAMVATALASGRCAVLDADALTSFSENANELFDMIRTAKALPVLTPHAGEFFRLFAGGDSASKLELSRSAAKKSGAVIVFKGADTVIAAPDGRAAINANAPPFLATAGAGDVLTGLICGLAAQGVPAFEAACAGVWIHGEAAQSFGPGLTAGGLPPLVAAVMARLHHS